MSNESISKIAKYVAFLYREADIWRCAENKEKFDLFVAKIETAKDMCALLDCKKKVWSEAGQFYDFVEEE